MLLRKTKQTLELQTFLRMSETIQRMAKMLLKMAEMLQRMSEIFLMTMDPLGEYLRCPSLVLAERLSPCSSKPRSLFLKTPESIPPNKPLNL